MSFTRIEASAPTRVDLAGGTLDLWPLYLFHKNSLTVNLAINVMTHVVLKPRSDSRVILRSLDTNKEQSYFNLDEVPEGAGHDLHLLRVHAEFWRPNQGFELETRSESPVGAGIAASSSLNIALCGAFSQLTGLRLSDDEMVTLAGNLEAKVIKAPTGCQDYFPALYGGGNTVELTALGPRRSSLGFDLKEFENRFILIYTGRPHHSGLNNWQIFKDHIDNHRQTHESFEGLKDVALKVRDVVQNRQWDKLGPLFDEEFKCRVKLSKLFSCPEIERLRTIALSNGAEALKICGAGGGGCVFLWCPPTSKKELEEKCREEGFQILKATPTASGLEVKTF